jgi:hypothetical protein
MPIELGPNSLLGAPAATLKKPPYLILLEKASGKTQIIEKFISLDKPEITTGFIQVKGIFCTKNEEDIIKGFYAIVSSSPKEAIVEMMFPHNRVISIRSLVFNAVKAITTTTIGKE